MSFGRLLIPMLAWFFRDLFGITRVCGPRIAFLWLLCVVKTFPECFASHTLMPADKAMGTGPFNIRGVIIGSSEDQALDASVVFSGIREIWVRNVYLGAVLSIPEHGTIVDLGANRGTFTALALAKSPSARVLAVEPSRLLNQSFSKMIAVNGWSHRATLIPAFVGSLSVVQKRALAEDRHYIGIPFIDPDKLVAEVPVIDFLKCDIEGSEFGLLDSSIFAKASQLAVEVHDFSGDRKQFIEGLTKSGFNVLSVKHSPSSCIVLAARVANSPALSVSSRAEIETR